MRYILLLVFALTLIGCVSTPQTREEFKKIHQELGNGSIYSSSILIDTYVSRRRFEDTVAMLVKKWRECYNTSRTMSRTSGGVRTMNIVDTYHPSFKKISNSLFEMTLQEKTEGMNSLNKVPEGGLYMVALDLKRMSDNKTKLSWFSNKNWTRHWEKNKIWSQGKNSSCVR